MVNTPARPVSTRRFRRFTIVTLATSLVLIALGGAVRATDSGLACPTWPGCFSAGDFVPALQLNVWLEHSHRLVAGLVGLQIAALLVWVIVRHRSERAVLVTTVVAAVAVNLQALLGALAVWRLLRAELVTAHLGMAMLIVACLAFLVVRTSAPRARQGPRDLALARSAGAVAALCFLQILVGGHVTGIGAGLAFTDFPLMGGAVFPELTGEREVFHAAHRVLAYALAAAVVWLAVRAVRAAGAHPALLWPARLARWAVALVLLQIGIGVGNLHTGLSWLTVIPHLAVASWLWTVLVFLALLAYRDAPAPSAAPEAAVHRELASR